MLRSHRQIVDSDERRKRLYEDVTLVATVVGVIVVAISTVVTAWMAILTGSQLEVLRAQQGSMEAQQRTMEAQQRIMESQQRPWLSASLDVPKDSEGLSFSAKGEPILWLDLKIANVGQAVGTEIEADTQMVAIGDSKEQFAKVSEAQKELCERARILSRDRTNELGFSLFPGEKKTKSELLYVKQEEINDAVSKSKDQHIEFIVVGCVSYKFYVSQELHQTGFAFDIRRRFTKRTKISATEELVESGTSSRFQSNRKIRDISVERSLSGNHFAY